MKTRHCILTLFIAIIAFTTNSLAQDRTNMSMTGSFNDDVATGSFSSGFPKDVYRQPIVFIGDDNRVYRIVYENERVTELYIDGVQATVDHITDSASVDRKLAKFIEMRRESERMEKMEAELDAEDNVFDAVENELERKEEKADRLEQKIDNEEERISDLEDDEDDRSSSKKESIADARAAIAKKRTELVRIQEEIEREQKELEARRKKVEAKYEVISNKWEEFGDMQYREMEKVLDRILGELRAANLAPNSGKASFKLSNRELIVNGKSAPRDVFERMRMKFVGDDPRGTFGFLYKWNLKWK